MLHRIAIALLLCLCGCSEDASSSAARPDESVRAASAVSSQVGATARAPAQIAFRDVSLVSGISLPYQTAIEGGYRTILEVIGGGVSALDYDRDGRLDLYFTGGAAVVGEQQFGGLPGALYRQRQHLQFEPAPPVANVQQAEAFTFGTAAADFNNDGFDDVLVTGFETVTLWQNQGDGTFLNVTDNAALRGVEFSTSAAWGDLNLDGALDLYVARYVDWSWQNHPDCIAGDGTPDVCPPRRFNGLDHVAFVSDGAGGFTRVTPDTGLVGNGKGLGVVAGDVDLDGDVDLYVGNDTTPNFLFLNEATENRPSGGSSPADEPPPLRMLESGLLMGVALDNVARATGSMGVDFCDYNLDGLPDIWVANYEREAFGLYRQEAHRGFFYASDETGVASIGQLFVGFGTQWGDLDHDGDEDVMVLNGHVIRSRQLSPISQQPVVLRNDHGQMRRESYPLNEYLGGSHLGRGLILADLDSDGDLDMVGTHLDRQPVILENVCVAPERSVVLTLIGTRASRTPIGASAVLTTSRGKQLRLVKGGGSYLCSSAASKLHWGLATGEVPLSIDVQWPGGGRQQFVPQHGLTTGVERAE